jgi:hypothetical protein
MGESLMQAPSEPAGPPAPTGRHRVGRASFDLVDPNRTDIYSANPQDPRELVIWTWYPAAPGPGPVAPPTCPIRGPQPASCSALTPPGC